MLARRARDFWETPEGFSRLRAERYSVKKRGIRKVNLFFDSPESPPCPCHSSEGTNHIRFPQFVRSRKEQKKVCELHLPRSAFLAFPSTLSLKSLYSNSTTYLLPSPSSRSLLQLGCASSLPHASESLFRSARNPVTSSLSLSREAEADSLCFPISQRSFWPAQVGQRHR